MVFAIYPYSFARLFDQELNQQIESHQKTKDHIDAAKAKAAQAEARIVGCCYCCSCCLVVCLSCFLPVCLFACLFVCLFACSLDGFNFAVAEIVKMSTWKFQKSRFFFFFQIRRSTSKHRS